MVKKKLFLQLYMPSLILTAIVLFALASFSINAIRDFYYNQVSEELFTYARVLEEPVSNFLNEKKFEQLDTYCKSQGKLTGNRITVILPDGKVVAESNRSVRDMASHKDRVEIVGALREGKSTSTRPSGTENADTMYVAIRLEHGDHQFAVLRTSLTLLSVEKVFNNILSKITLGVIAAIIIMAVSSIVILAKITKPLAKICTVAGNFASGNLTSRAPACEIEELNALSTVLNDMAGQLDSRIKTIVEQRNETEAIFNNMSEGLLAINSNRQLININNAAADIFNIDVENALKHDIAVVIRKAELIDFVQHTFQSSFSTETEITVPGKTDRHLLIHGAKYEQKGEETGVIIVVADITRLKRLENLRKEFVANVSHELKTPITAIRGFVETLQDGAIDDKEQAAKFLDIIARQSERMHALIEDLLSLSRLEHNNSANEITFDDVNIADMLNDITEMFNSRLAERNISVNIDCEDNLSIRANKALLIQAVSNLLDNAIKYSPENDSIDLFTDIDDNELFLNVRDNGCGIPSDHHDRLFERFYVVDKSRSRKLGGTGLGLAIVKHIARVHNGNVTVNSTAGKGSTFTIIIPV